MGAPDQGRIPRTILTIDHYRCFSDSSFLIYEYPLHWKMLTRYGKLEPLLVLFYFRDTSVLSIYKCPQTSLGFQVMLVVKYPPANASDVRD